MRNLKKILSLALALMMILSVTASAAFTDAAKIDADYAEAVEVLNGMKVFQGYEDGSFGPTKAITRAEVAAIIYRIDTKDVKSEDVALYVGSANFSDVKAADWFSGYVGYCANAGYIKGYEDGSFKPNKTVTGFEALAMILRAMGYDAENEFSGAQWSQNIAKIATKAGILDTVKPGQLALAGTREMIAQLLFDAIQAKTVKFYPAWGYLENATSIGDTFKLTKVTGVEDAWGRPAYKWTYTTGNEKTEFPYAAKAKHNVAVTECDLASELGLSKLTNVVTYTNGVKNVGADTINPIATTAKLGAQGRQLEVYKVGDVYRIVYIDTYLAKVASVSAASFDAAGHLKTSSKMVLNVWTGASYETVTLYGGKDNYTYASGDMVLVNAVDAANGAIATELGTYGTTATKLDVLGLATSMVGAQTILWWNVAQHTVNGTNYNDAVTFYLNEAKTDIGNHAWYFDQYGNLIGVVDIATQYTYGVISQLWWANDASTGSGVAKAIITYMDGSTEMVNLKSVDLDGITVYNADGTVKSGNNLPYTATYSTETDNVMMCTGTSTITAGTFYVSTNAVTNANSTRNGKNGIIGGHMFQFSTLADGSVVAYKVQEQIDGATVNKGVSKIAGTAGAPIYTNSDTMYLVKTSAGYTAVTGFNNIGNYNAATVDSVNIDADIYAEYVYLFGTAADATSSAFVMSNGTNYNAALYTDANGIEFYQFTYGLSMDGTTSTLKVVNGDYDKDGVNDVAGVITKMVNGVGKLYLIEYLNGYAVEATEIGTVAVESVPYSALYLGTDVAATADALYDASTGNAYNVTSTTVVIGGTLADLATPGASVYVVYNSNTPNYVDYIYITGFAKNTAADAETALKAVPAATAHDYGTKVVAATATADDLKKAALAEVNAKLAAAGVTGVTAEITVWYDVEAPLYWFTVKLTDAMGTVKTVEHNKITLNASIDYAAAIKAHLEGMTVAQGSSEQDVKTAIAGRVGGSYGTWSYTVTKVEFAGVVATGQPLVVTVTGTVGETPVAVTGIVRVG